MGQQGTHGRATLKIHLSTLRWLLARARIRSPTLDDYITSCIVDLDLQELKECWVRIPEMLNMGETMG